MCSRSRFPALALATIAMLWSTPVAGSASTCAVHAQDTIAGLGTEVSVTGCTAGSQETLSITGPQSARYAQTIAIDATGEATTLIPSKVTVTAGSYTVDVQGTSGTFKVLPDRPDDAHSTLIVSPESIRATGKDTATVTLVLRDRFDNPVPGRPAALLSSRTSDAVTAVSSQTDDQGRFLWSVTTLEGGTITLIPYDILGNRQMKLLTTVEAIGTTARASLTGLEQGGDPSPPVSADIAPVIVDKFELSLPQGAESVKANELFSLTIRAVHNGSVVRAYVGTLIVTATDPDAELPKKGEDARNPENGRIDIRDVDQGERKVPLAFVLRQGGKQTITVVDKLDSSLRGETTIDVQSGTGQDGKISIVSPQDRTQVKGTTVLLQGKAPSLVNLVVKGGVQTVQAESDAEGVFRISVPLNPADKEVTLFVASENGTYESDPVHIIIDNDAPKINSITIDPQEGKAGDAAAITVTAEEDTTQVTATLERKQATLEHKDAAFVGTITAPTKEGSYDVTVVATDQVGNATTMLTKWTVKPKTTPVVQGVKAEGRLRQVVLSWEAVNAVPIAEYRIYIADLREPENILYSIPTKQPVTSVAIADLTPGVTYLFAVTAMGADGTESPEKSTPVSASPLGFAVTVEPGDGSLLLKWIPPASLPLAKYILEFGTDAGVYTERRIVDGRASSTTLRDLLNNVHYYLKLTPVTVTGKTESDLAALADGTPEGSQAFVPGQSEPVPSDLVASTNLHPGANLAPVTPQELYDVPETTGSGIPSWTVGILAIVAIVLGMQWHLRRKERILTNNFLRMMEERYEHNS